LIKKNYKMKPNRLQSILNFATDKFGDKDAIVSIASNSCHTYKDLLSAANSAAILITLEFGCSPGFMMLSAENNYQFIVLLFAGLIANKTVVPIPTDIDNETLNFIISDCKPFLICVDDEQSYDVKKNSQTYEFSYMSSASLLQNLEKSNKRNCCGIGNPDFINNNAIAFVIYTSGSTGEPRGVICPHIQVLFAINSINLILETTYKDRILCGLPFSFDYGLYQIFLSIQNGSTIVVAPDFNNPLAIPGWLNKYGITGFPGVPSLFKLLVSSKLLARTTLKKLRYISSTGDVFHVETIDELQSQIPTTSIYSMYGLTECKRVSILKPEEYLHHKGSVGHPIPGTTIRIVDQLGASVKSGEVGELVVYGNHIMKGYLNNKSATLMRFKLCPIKNEMCLFSGDLFHHDEEGYLYFEGRKQGFIKARGKRISPFQIERSLRNLSGVDEAIVVGLPHKVEGETLFAFVKFERNVSFTPHVIAEFSRKKLPVPIELSHIHKLNGSFPVNNNGKIDRIILKKMAEDIVSNQDNI
jgi:long-chain acyl-CoA synthetase